jgi:hypothetical protein
MAVYAGRLVVSSQQEKIVGVLGLVGQQQRNGLDRVAAAVYVVSQKEVV